MLKEDLKAAVYATDKGIVTIFAGPLAGAFAYRPKCYLMLARLHLEESKALPVWIGDEDIRALDIPDAGKGDQTAHAQFRRYMKNPCGPYEL
jgi:hypothetical protein